MRAVSLFLISFMLLLCLSSRTYEVWAQSSATSPCGSTQTCTINLSANTCSRCNSTIFADISNVHWNATNRTLGFTADGASGGTATANISIPKTAVLNRNAGNIKVYVKGVQVPTSQVRVAMNSTHFFTAFNVTFASPVNAAISLGIIGVSMFPNGLLALLTLLSVAILPISSRKHRNPS